MVGQLPLDVKRIKIHHDAAGAQHGEEIDDRIRRVRQTQPNPRAGHHAQPLQAPRRLVHQLVELRITPAPAEKLDGRPGRIIAR
jgi:hypothetical protein